MRIVVLSCHAYRDTWKPFFSLFRKFWPNCRYPIHLVSDSIEESDEICGIQPFPTGTANWCTSFSMFAEDYSEDPILMLQDDFFLTRPVNSELVQRGLSLMNGHIGAVRLYPCPGAEMDSEGTEYFGTIPHGFPYRVSCQASLWNPGFIRDICAQDRVVSARDFELNGGPWADQHSPFEVLAFRRDITPWPLEYLCSAISRGKWDPDAKRLCDLHGIDVDWSRGFITAA